MILTKERLEKIITEIYDNSADNIQNTIREICEEMRQLDSDFGRAGIIGEVSLRGKTISDMPRGSGGELKDLSSVSIMVTKHKEYQMKVLRESLQQCLNKQKVIFQIRNSLLKLSEEHKKFLFYDCRYSQRKARELLAEENITVSRVTYTKTVSAILDKILSEVNEKITDFEDYEDYSFELSKTMEE